MSFFTVKLFAILLVQNITGFCPAGFNGHPCVHGFDKTAGKPIIDQDCMDSLGLTEKDLLEDGEDGEDDEDDAMFDAMEDADLGEPDSDRVLDTDLNESEMLTDEHSVEQDVTPCTLYWGYPTSSGPDWIPGTWDTATGEEGQRYQNCYSDARTNWTKLYAPEQVADSPEWPYVRLKLDHICVSDALCKMEHSDLGWCSSYYTKEILKTCDPDPYRDVFCTEACPGAEYGLSKA